MADAADLEPREGGGRGVCVLVALSASLLSVFFFLPKIRGKRPARDLPLSKALRCLRSNL